jgi:hypothetical protein
MSAAAVARGPTMQQMSEAIPFMEKPKNIDSGMAGGYQAADAAHNSHSLAGNAIEPKKCIL